MPCGLCIYLNQEIIFYWTVKSILRKIEELYTSCLHVLTIEMTYNYIIRLSLEYIGFPGMISDIVKSSASNVLWIYHRYMHQSIEELSWDLPWRDKNILLFPVIAKYEAILIRVNSNIIILCNPFSVETYSLVFINIHSIKKTGLTK